jgi:transposase
MRQSHVRILPALVAAAAVVVPARLPLSARSADVYGPFLPASVQYGPVPSHGKEVQLSEGDRVAREILRTDQMIAGADGRIRRSGNDRARSDLKNSRERQVEAREAVVQSFYARANRLTLEARAYVKSALIQAGPPENDPEVVARALDQSDDALARGKDVLEAASATRLLRSLAALRDQQEDARRLYKNGVMRSAYEETREVRSGVVDLLHRCADAPVSRETAKKALRRADQAEAQARKDLGPRNPSQVRRLQHQAEEQLARAHDSFAKSAYRDSFLRAQLVERTLQRALDASRLAVNAGD